jgi:hypothetical protein
MEKRSWPSKIRKDKLWNKRDKRCCSTDWLMHTLHHSPSLVYHSTCNHRSLHHSPHRDTRLDRAPLKPIIVLLQSSSDCCSVVEPLDAPIIAVPSNCRTPCLPPTQSVRCCVRGSTRSEKLPISPPPSQNSHSWCPIRGSQTCLIVHAVVASWFDLCVFSFIFFPRVN